MKKQLAVLLSSLLCGVLSAQTITIDPDTEHQRMVGFGAFGGIKPYWDNPPYYTEDFIDLIVNDMGLNIFRTNVFWDLEPQNENDDPFHLELEKFNYRQGSKLHGQLAYYRALKEAGVKRFIASIWTPPIWMKINVDNSLASFCEGQCGGQLNPKYYHEFAEYCVAFVKIVEQETGIQLYALSLQNELRFLNPFESATYTPEAYAKVLKLVKQRFKREGISTKIFGPEDMGRFQWNLEYGSAVFGDAEAREAIDIWAVHSYIDGVAPDYGSADGWTNIYEYVNRNGKPLWMTETSGYPQTWQGAMDLAKSIHLALKFGNVSAWVYWSLSDPTPSEFALTVAGEPTKNYYVSKNYYKFIRPESIRIQADSEDDDLLVTAFKNSAEGSVTVVLINNSTETKTASLELTKGPQSFSLYRSSETEDFAAIGEVESSVELPPSSVSTLVGYVDKKGPFVNEVLDQYIRLEHGGAIEIPLTGVSSGNDDPVSFEIASSNEAVLAAQDIAVSYNAEAGTGTLSLTPNTSETGRTTITIKLTNSNVLNNGELGFNSFERSFEVDVFSVVSGIRNAEDPGIRVFPNPATGDVVIRSDGSAQLKHVRVVDMSGREFINKALIPQAELKLEAETFPGKGVYLVLLETSVGLISKKLVRN